MKIIAIQQTRLVQVSSPTAKKVVFKNTPITEAQILNVGKYPNITIVQQSFGSFNDLPELN